MSSHLPANILEQVKIDIKAYAVPFAQYMWGFYYNKELFQSLGLATTASWQDFLNICSTLKNSGIAPLVQPNIEGWETQGWMDFITMMVGGTPLRQALVTEQQLDSSMSASVVQTFGNLIDKNYFFSGANEWRWQQTFPIMGRELAGMTLIGQFAEKFISADLDHKIGFFPFPDSVNNGTVAALDLGWLPVDLVNFTPPTKDERLEVAITHLINAGMIRQYFDRDSDQAYATKVHAAIRSAIANGNSKYLQAIVDQ